MPYLDQAHRKWFAGLLEDLDANAPDTWTPGEFNYVVTKLAQMYMGPKSYEALERVIGGLESVKLEFYRRAAAPYEDQKIEENGDVY